MSPSLGAGVRLVGPGNVPAACVEGARPALAAATSISSPHVCKAASVQAPRCLLSLQSALALQPENFLTHPSDHITPPLKTFSSAAKPKALSLAGKVFHD